MKPVRSVSGKVNALRENDPHCPALPMQGETPPPAGGRPQAGREGVAFAPAFWAPSGADIMPEGYIAPEAKRAQAALHSEWDAINLG
jgi:hypothetical protein